MTPEEMRDWVDALLKSGADVNRTDKNGVTPLHHAVRFRSPAGVKMLIEHGANVNQACRRSGSTPLHRAVRSTGAPGTAGRQAEAREIVEMLLSAGADASIRNKRGRTPADDTTDPAMRELFTRGE